MSQILPALKIIKEWKKAPVGYQKIPCHVKLDMKMDFTQKAPDTRFVAGDHVTDPRATQTYATVWSLGEVWE